MRTRPPLRKGASTSFGQLNAGKKSVVLDLKNKRAVDGRPAAGRTRPTCWSRTTGRASCSGSASTMRRWPQVNPRLVYCSISGYGQTGPSADLAAYAPVIHAASGFDLAHIAYQRGPHAARQLRHLHRRRADRHLCVRRHRRGAAPARRDRQGPAHRRVDAREHADADARRDAGRAVRGAAAAAAADLRPGRDQGRLSSISRSRASARSRASPRRRAASDWITDPRFAKYLDRRGNWGELMDEFEVWSKTLPERRRCLAALDKNARAGGRLPHGARGDGRSAARPSPGVRRGARCRRHVQGAEPAVPHVGLAHARPARAWRRSASTRPRCCRQLACPRRRSTACSAKYLAALDRAAANCDDKPRRHYKRVEDGVAEMANAVSAADEGSLDATPCMPFRRQSRRTPAMYALLALAFRTRTSRLSPSSSGIAHALTMIDVSWSLTEYRRYHHDSNVARRRG